MEPASRSTYVLSHPICELRHMAFIRVGLSALLLFAAAAPVSAQRSDSPTPSARVHAITGALLQSSKDLGTMATALRDTPDWQVAINLRGISERVIHYCTAIDNLVQVQAMVSNHTERATIGDFIRNEVRTRGNPLFPLAYDWLGGRG